jgi:Raf kinase inhibitor-like YbhB/YbcL family protein
MTTISRRFVRLAILGLAGTVCGCESKSNDTPLVLRCATEDGLPGFRNLEFMPPAYTLASGANHSPPLQWTDGREATAQWAIVFEDRDAEDEQRIRWIIYNLPAYLRQLPAGIPTGIADLGREFFGARQGRNIRNQTVVGYHGPQPAPGTGVHRYRFTLFALDAVLDIPAGATIEDLRTEIEGHVLASAVLDCKYGVEQPLDLQVPGDRVSLPNVSIQRQSSEELPNTRGPGPPEPADD